MIKRFISFIAVIAIIASPAIAANKKPLVLSSTGTTQQIQAGDTLVFNKAAVESAASGSLASNYDYLFNPQFFGVKSTTDNQASGDAGANIPTLFSIQHNFGGSAVDSGRNALGVALHMTIPTKSDNPYRFYAAGNFIGDTSVNDGGTGGSPQGYMYGVGGVARLKTGATHWKGVIAGDFEVSAETGTSSQIVTPVLTTTWPDHVVHGTLLDAHFVSIASGVGMTNGWQLSDDGGSAPIITTGTLIRAQGGWTISDGIDLSGITISNWLLKGGGVIETTSTAAATSPTTGAVRVAGGIGVAGAGYFGGVVVAPTFTIAGLPTCNSTTKGGRAVVSNGQTTPAFLGTVSTTGAVVAPVFCNGSAWVYG